MRACELARNEYIDKWGDLTLSDYPSSRRSRDIAKFPKFTVFAAWARLAVRRSAVEWSGTLLCLVAKPVYDLNKTKRG
jgi:hypothetical protein